MPLGMLAANRPIMYSACSWEHGNHGSFLRISMGFTDTHGESCGESYGDMSNLDLMGFHMFEDFNGGGEEGGSTGGRGADDKSRDPRQTAGGEKQHNKC